MNNKEEFVSNDFLIQFQQMNYDQVIKMIEVFSPIISFYATRKVLNNYRLIRDYKPKNIKKINMPPELIQHYTEIDFDKLASMQLSNAIVEFVEVLLSRFQEKDLINFYNNINELKIKVKNFKFQNLIFGRNYAGTYNTRNKKVQVEINNRTLPIYHELFHMASSSRKNGISYSGFRQTSSKPGVLKIGRAINEGYTQLLTERYFGDIPKVKGGYSLEVRIVKELEKIIGQNLMESLYLNANLPGLINELKIYSTSEDISNFFSHSDFLIYHFKSKNLPTKEEEKITKSLKIVFEFLLKAYINKIKIQLENNTINTQEFNDKLTSFIASLGNNLKCGEYIYEYLTSESIEKILKEIFNNSDLLNIYNYNKPLF